jgi:hypothetical protein
MEVIMRVERRHRGRICVAFMHAAMRGMEVRSSDPNAVMKRSPNLTIDSLIFV